MKNTLIIFMSLILLGSCEKRENLFEKYNEAPVLLIEKNREKVGELYDSIKIGRPMTYNLIVKNEGDITFNFEELEGGSVILKNTNDIVVIGQKTQFTKGQITFTTSSQGLFYGKISAVDLFGAIGYFDFELTSFHNVLPICKLDVKKISEYSNYEVEISLEKSYDPDVRFGGGIVEYEYRIGNYYVLKTNEFKKIRHIFPEEGTYTIRCRVKDTDGGWSSFVYNEINI